MQWPTVDEFLELRRGLPVLAALLFVAALVLPMWEISVQAVQYPEQALKLELFAYPRIEGDYVEMASLNHYIGFYYPDPVLWPPNFEVHPRAVDVPEWSLGPLAFVAVAALSVFVAVAPSIRKLKRGLIYQFAGTVAVFTIMLVDIQVRLWQAGHTLDPDAPVLGVEGFTPPLIGSYEVANITSYSAFGPGVGVAGAAIVLLAVAFYYRDESVHLSDLPGRVAARVGLGSHRSDRASPSPGECDDGHGSPGAEVSVDDRPEDGDGAVPPPQETG